MPRNTCACHEALGKEALTRTLRESDEFSFVLQDLSSCLTEQACGWKEKVLCVLDRLPNTHNVATQIYAEFHFVQNSKVGGWNHKSVCKAKPITSTFRHVSKVFWRKREAYFSGGAWQTRLSGFFMLSGAGHWRG